MQPEQTSESSLGPPDQQVAISGEVGDRPTMRLTRRPLTLRIALALGMVAATILGWVIIKQIEAARIHGAIEKLRDRIEAHWSETTLKDFQLLRSICDELESNQILTAPQFVARAQAVRSNNDVYHALYWVSGDATPIAGVAPTDTTLQEVLPEDGDAALFTQLKRRAGVGGPVASDVYQDRFGRGLVLFYLPLAQPSRGGVAAVIRIDRLMEHFVDDELRESASLDFVRDGRVIYRTGDYLVDRNPDYRVVARLQMLDQVWLCQIIPSTKFVGQYRTSASVFVLYAGLICCVLAGWSVLVAVKHKWQHAILERGHLQFVSLFSQCSRKLMSHRGDLQESLKCLLEAAHRQTQCDVVAVYYLSADRRKLSLVSSYGDLQLESPVVELAESAIDALRGVSEGRTLRISHRDVPSLFAMRMFEPTELNGGVISPLMLDRMIGLVFYGSRSGERWTDGRTALAELWASQCASTLADETLHQQMRDAISVQEKLAHRREMMLNLLGEIFQAGTIDGTLAHIAQTAPRSLGVEACVVSLSTKRDNELEIVAGTGELGVRLFGTRISLAGEQIVRMSRPGSAVVIDLADVHRYGLTRLVQNWLAAIAVVPMTHANGRPIGWMLLLTSRKSGFTDDQIELARVLASRASAAIETAELNQQIRRDAESRAMLLRELNHRVKNNLAGIVGLLSMSATMEMPENVRQWLDRVADRIGNMARAHELFSGGISTVALAQLVEQIVPSLAVVKPPGVSIVRDLGEREILLKTSQAVSLAMIIHELSYNAVVHGLGEHGTLTIRARSSGQHVTVEVIDDGTSALAHQSGTEDGAVATIAPPVASTGMGLRLVKGLVGRELRGRFAMSRRSEGGTVVTVEFPLERDTDEGEVTK